MGLQANEPDDGPQINAALLRNAIVVRSPRRSFPLCRHLHFFDVVVRNWPTQRRRSRPSVANVTKPLLVRHIVLCFGLLSST